MVREEICYTDSPIGFTFTSKKQTEASKYRLIRYWENKINSIETEQEYKDAILKGEPFMDLIDWYNKYTFRSICDENWLVENKFIKVEE